MKLGVVIWWAVFVILSVIIQSLVPALDALVIGLILVLQEKRYKDLLWILPLFILVQEGIGSRDFGGMIFWYAAVIIIFIIGRWLFEVQNALFVLLMATCLGGLHFVLVYTLAPLQDLVVDMQMLIRESIYQALYVPVAWWLANLTRRWAYGHVDAI